MKLSRPVLVAAALLAAVGCTSAPPPNPPPAATPTPSPDAAERAKLQEKVDRLTGIKPPADVDEGPTDPVPFVDPETGKRLLKLPKGGLYYERNGRVYLAIVNSTGFPIVRQDDTAYFVEAPPERKKPDPNARKADAPEDLAPLVEMSKFEAELVTPKTSQDPLRFEEMSAGLPRAGMWRENFDLGDVLGLGHPQIVAPPARLTGPTLKVFRLDKDADGKPRWEETPLSSTTPRRSTRHTAWRRRGHDGDEARHRLRRPRLRARDRVRQGGTGSPWNRAASRARCPRARSRSGT